ncbi:ubiquitin carboxyl-terminal hydrolase 7-like isoform X2 [Paramacrobiotus metropolitanus]|uniref:ubiquitin carboxyl-terminal hydrolase 7-like isoform X2 n=1 Tax=Paramacrobiotus metropolitanus TaxID=2943436 RepID=UPI0024459158|nr:ubiquitin carboxyl-terminal hydrolase 7-like isoform X2 [Paramacrobiotus metropolitanus]
MGFGRRKKDKRNTNADTMDNRPLLDTPMDIVHDRSTAHNEDSIKEDDDTEPSNNGNNEPLQDQELMDTLDNNDMARDENVPMVDNLTAEETMHPVSPLQPDTSTDMARPGSSNESFDGEKLDDDDDSRADGVINFTVPDIRKLQEAGTLSNSIQVRNLPWKIMVMKRRGRGSASHMHDESWTLGYFLQCNADAESTSWTCHASAELRLLPWKSDTPAIKRPISHMFYNKENDWGFTNFIQMEDLMDPVKGYINPTDYSLKLQVTLNADPPHGVCWDSKKYTGYIGLKNQGATCYMNSLLQALYFTNKLKKAVYLIPTEAEDPVRSVPLAVQRVFYELQTSDKPVGTKKLTKSFGWETLDSFMQHDAQELCRVLLDNMDMKMKLTRVEGTIPRLFEGKMISFIRCKNISYESSREESFMDVQLNVKDRKDVYASFDDYVELEVLDGDNKYDAGDHGLQEAEKGIAFVSFPPVLHLQLKRFQFDPISESNIKINDRFEFPERLDLTKYLQEQADVPPIYFLHAVLVHSGDNHGGHYVVYINPKGDGKWCKFDDDVVVKCQKKEAIERNYGGSSDEFLQFRNCTNAYMLVYINESLKGEILQPVTENDVPGYLKERFAEERETEARRRQEKMNQNGYVNLRVVTEDDLAVHQGHELIDLEKIQHKKPVRIRKEITVKEIHETLAELFGYKTDEIKYWLWQHRQNGTFRPTLAADDLLKNHDQSFVEIFGEEDEQLIVLLEIIKYRNPHTFLNANRLHSRRQQDEEMVLFFRLYDPVRRVLEYKGFDLVSQKITPKELMEICIQKGDFPPGTPLLLFNDFKQNAVEKINIAPEQSFARYQTPELNDGDLIIFQKLVTSEQEEHLSLPTVKEYFKDLTFRTEIEFVDKERPNDEIRTFMLTLNLRMSYQQVVSAVAARLQTDPKRIQLFRCQNSVRDTAGSAIAGSCEQTLHHLVQSRLSMSKSKKLFYQQLDMDIDELESRKEVKILWQPNYRDEGREYTVLVNKRGTVADILEQMKKVVELSPDGSGQLRLIEVMNSRITNVFQKTQPLENISSISGNKIFRVEEVPVEQVQVKNEEGENLIPVAHFQKESHQNFGIPFFIKVKQGEEFSEVKERIRKLLDVPEKEFEKYKFCVIHMGKAHHLEDSTKVNTRELIPYGGAFSIWLGIDHVNRTPKRPRPNYMEKAVKIYN